MPSSPAAYALPIGTTSSRAAARRSPSTPSRRPRRTLDRVEPVEPVEPRGPVNPVDPAIGVPPRRAAASEGSASSVGCAHRALCLTVVLALAQGMPLVVLLLAGRDRDLHLGAAVLEVERQRHDGAPALAGLVRDLLELGAVQEQLALAAGGVVVPRAVEVLGDVDVLEVELVAGEHREAVDQRRPPHPQRLDLGAGEHDAGLEGVVDEVVVSGLAVARDERPPLLLGHRTVLPPSW